MSNDADKCRKATVGDVPGRWIGRFGVGCLVALLAGCGGPAEDSDTGIMEEVPPHRLVWVRKVDQMNDTWLHEWDNLLLGYDSVTGETRELIGEPERFLRPLFSPDGEWVVFSTSPEPGPGADGAITERIRWDGSGRAEIGKGVAVDVLTDVDGRTWVYLGREVGKHGNYTAEKIVRVPWDDPSAEPEVVWDREPTTLDNVQISGDGRWMSGSFPWPEVGRVDLVGETLEPVEQGCWPSMAPDSSGLLWLFDGRHRNVRFVLEDEIRPVRINGGPGMDGYEVYHPRWSNHPLYFVCTGPYLIGETDVRITGGGEAVGIMMGRFDRELTEVKDWWRISGGDGPDFYPDLWVEGGEDQSLDMERIRSAEVEGASTQAPTLGDGWPPSGEGVRVQWEHARARNRWFDGQGEGRKLLMEGLGNAVLAEDHSLQLQGGAFITRPVIGDRLAAAARRTNQFTWSAVVSAAEPSLTGTGRVFSLSSGADERNFTLDQVKDRWQVRWRTIWSRDSARETALDLGPIRAGQPVHLVISYREPELKVWIDGEGETYRRGRNQDLGNWTPQEWIIGNEWGGGAPWPGRVQALLWYDRALGDEEAAALHAAVMPRLEQIRDSKPRPTRVRATLLGSNPIPTLAEVHPYQSHLEVFSWRIGEVLAGDDGLEQKEVEVLQWVILNGRDVPHRELKPGATGELHLVPVDTQPQLGGVSQGTPKVDRMHLPLYYKVNPPGRGWQGVPPLEGFKPDQTPDESSGR